jgi:Phage Tail Collar Domain
MAVLKYRDPTTGTWVALPAIEGPAGPAGAPGANGATGPTGPMGAGTDEVHVANDAPTDANIELWVDPDDPTGSGLSSRSVPTGMIAPFAGSVPPQGWILCNGEAVDKTEYPELFAVIGTVYDDRNSDPHKFGVPLLLFSDSSPVSYIIKT